MAEFLFGSVIHRLQQATHAATTNLQLPATAAPAEGGDDDEMALTAVDEARDDRGSARATPGTQLKISLPRELAGAAKRMAERLCGVGVNWVSQLLELTRPQRRFPLMLMPRATLEPASARKRCRAAEECSGAEEMRDEVARDKWRQLVRFSSLARRRAAAFVSESSASCRGAAHIDHTSDESDADMRARNAERTGKRARTRSSERGTDVEGPVAPTRRAIR